MIKKITSGGQSVKAQNQFQKMSWLTEPEVLDAAYQLIQLSGDSAAADSSSSSRAEANGKYEAESCSVGDGDINICTSAAAARAGKREISSSSSSSNAPMIITMAQNLDACEEIEASSLRKRKFRSIADLYVNTKPLVKTACC